MSYLEALPPKYICSITDDCFVHPVTLQDCHHTFEQAALQAYAQNTFTLKCPLCNNQSEQTADQLLNVQSIPPNHILAQEIKDFINTHHHLFDNRSTQEFFIDVQNHWPEAIKPSLNNKLENFFHEFFHNEHPNSPNQSLITVSGCCTAAAISLIGIPSACFITAGSVAMLGADLLSIQQWDENDLYWPTLWNIGAGLLMGTMLVQEDVISLPNLL